MSRRILIIKLGALGDVIRTTPVLRRLEGNITWVTSRPALPLLSGNPLIRRLLAVEDGGFRVDGRYDLVINLEDDLASAQMASSAAGGDVIGPYIRDGKITYDQSRGEWYDMSLSSRYGKETADQLKLANRKTYQEMIFAALGMKFAGEEPSLNLPLRNRTAPFLVGIEERAGAVWPAKRWTRYRALADRLRQYNYQVKVFRQRQTIVEYADDINECGSVICGDTLAMHLATALRKSVVCLFTCTSPWEIFGYGRMVKVISPLLERYFYSREDTEAPGDAISLEAVERAFFGVREPKANYVVAEAP